MKNRPKPTLRRLSRLALRTGIVVYAIMCVACASFQRKLMYFPPHYTPQEAKETAAVQHYVPWLGADGRLMGYKREWNVQHPTSNAQLSTGESKLENMGTRVERVPTNGEMTNSPPTPYSPFTNHPSVLFFHGNGDCACQGNDAADVLQQVAALDVYLLEYPGYADRPGAPSERTIDAAAEEAFASLPTNGPVYLVGESLGTGVAAYLAGKHPDRVAGVTVLGAYNRVTDVAAFHYPFLPVRWLLVDRYPAEDYLRTYHGPLAVAVAGRDQVVPSQFGHRLFDHYSGPKKLWEFPEGDHMTVMMQGPEFWKEVVGFWGTGK